MTVTSLSFTLVNTYAPQGVKPASVAERQTPPVPADDAGCEGKRPASRQNRLADAMMSALRELGFGATAAPAPATTPPSTGAAAPAATSTTAAATSAATPAATEPASAAGGSPVSVESAVQQFAHALFSALRQSDSGHKADDDDSGRAEGHGRHEHHHRRHGEGHGYGDMSQRLEALSQTFGAQAAAAPAATASTTAAPGSSLSVTLSVDDGAAATPAAASAPPAATTLNVAAATPAKNPLLDAFTKLFNTLKPAAAAAPATTPATDMAEKLRLFLHTLAQGVAPHAMGSVQRAQIGGLVNLTA